MSLKELNPKECRRWKYADRSSFEMGDLFLLAEDIKQNGQIEPVIVRPIEESGDIKYEVCLASIIISLSGVAFGNPQICTI